MELYKHIIRWYLPALILIASVGNTSAANKPLEFWVNSPTDVKYYTNMIKVYQEKVDKDFKINVHHYGFLELPDKLTVAIKTGINTPDIVEIDELFFSMFLPSQIPFVDMTDRIKKSGLNKNILQQRLSLFGYKDRLYGIPQSVAAVVLYYRSDLLSQYKINVNEFDTWENFIKSAKKVTNTNSVLLALDWSYFEILLKQRGFDFFDEHGSLMLDSPEVVETLEFLVSLSKDKVGRAPDRGNIFDPAFFSTDIKNNEYISVMSAGWYGMDMISNFSPPNAIGQWRAVQLPIWTDSKSKSKRPTSTFAGQGLCIYKKSKQIDKAWSFIEFVMNDIDANVERFVQRNCFPALVPSWADTRIGKPDSIFGGQSFGNLMAELAPQIPQTIQAPMRAQIIGLIREKYWNSLVSGNMAPAAVLKEIKAEVQKGMERK